MQGFCCHGRHGEDLPALKASAVTPVQRKRWDKKGEIDKERINYTSFWSDIGERNEEGRRRN